MKKITLSAVRYQLPEQFYVDVLLEKDEVSFWLGHRECDIREQIFAASAAFAPAEKWEQMILDNIDDYLEDFKEAWLEE